MANEVFLLNKCSYMGSSHKEVIGYFEKEEYGVNYLLDRGYVRNSNFPDRQLWEHKKDEDYDVWNYVELIKIKKMEL